MSQAELQQVQGAVSRAEQDSARHLRGQLWSLVLSRLPGQHGPQGRQHVQELSTLRGGRAFLYQTSTELKEELWTFELHSIISTWNLPPTHLPFYTLTSKHYM